MHDCSSSEADGNALVSDVQMCPIIDMNYNDFNCIYSTLLYIIKRAKALGIDTPLWLKAVEVSFAKRLNIVCRLGSFYVIMSYLGSLGSLWLVPVRLRYCNAVLHQML
jgi:hypothetical protein